MKQDFNFARVGDPASFFFAFLPALPASYDRITQVLRYFYDDFIELSEDPYLFIMTMFLRFCIVYCDD